MFRAAEMAPASLLARLAFILLCSSSVLSGDAARSDERVKSAVFLSPGFDLLPGSVADKFYYDVPFPRGHIFLKSFDAEVVDEAGEPVPLHEAYIHHWLITRYYSKTGGGGEKVSGRNSGTCPNTLGQIFGLGAETRRTETWIPDPYGIETGDPSAAPEGFEERWMLNVHTIDTRGAEDRLGCTECRCGLYNVTVDEYGRPLPAGYVGGLHCCYDGTRCRVTGGGSSRKMFLKYRVRWVDREEGLVPVMVYILDVTDAVVDGRRRCNIEYNVEPCATGEGCIDVRKVKVAVPRGGDIVYGVSHLHSAGVGSALYGQDGRLLCESTPMYGKGRAAGDEEGYIVGMSTCYPEPGGSARVSDGEELTVEMRYSSAEMHTGVMGLFYILVAQQPPVPELLRSGGEGEPLRAASLAGGDEEA